MPVEYAEGATYSWIVDGKLAGSEPTYTAVFTELGEVYITFRVETAAGKAEAELRVDVLELTPPVISLALPAEGLKVLPGVEYTFTPDIQHSDQEDFRCRWLGSYPIRIEASNDDGTSFKEFVVEVVEKMPSEVRFEKLSHYCKTTDRSTFVGRAVYLAPSLAYIADPQFVWSVDGEPVVAETGAVFKFTPGRLNRSGRCDRRRRCFRASYAKHRPRGCYAVCRDRRSCLCGRGAAPTPGECGEQSFPACGLRISARSRAVGRRKDRSRIYGQRAYP